MSLIVSIGLSSSLAATVAETAIGEVSLALALVVAILLLAFASGLFCASVLGRSRLCSWRCCGLVDSGASVFHDCCRVVHSVRLVCIGVEWSRCLRYLSISSRRNFRAPQQEWSLAHSHAAAASQIDFWLCGAHDGPPLHPEPAVLRSSGHVLSLRLFFI